MLSPELSLIFYVKLSLLYLAEREWIDSDQIPAFKEINDLLGVSVGNSNLASANSICLLFFLATRWVHSWVASGTPFWLACNGILQLYFLSSLHCFSGLPWYRTISSHKCHPFQSIHDEELKREFDLANSYRRTAFEDEFVRYAESMLTDVDKRIRKGKQRLSLSVKDALVSTVPSIYIMSDTLAEDFPIQPALRLDLFSISSHPLPKLCI